MIKTRISLGIVISILFFSSCAQKGEYFEDTLCIENVSLIDPEKGLIANKTVLIRDEKIYKVVTANELQLSPKNNIIDGTGKFLIPGLWDAHVHFAYLEELAPSMFNLFLGYGITSVRDTGGRIDFVKKWKDKSLKNPTEAPRVMIAGPLLDGLPNVYDGSDPGHPPLSVGLASVEDAQNKVNELDALGVDLLKAYEMLTEEQFRAITKLGNEKGLKVTGHVPLSMDVVSASNAGLNSMEHLRNLELSCASNADELLQERRNLLLAEKDSAGGILRSKIHQLQREIAIKNYDESKADEILKVLAKNQTWQIPTLALNTGLVTQHFTKAEMVASYAHLPEAIQENWKQTSKTIVGMKITPFRKKYADWSLNMVRKIHKAEIGIMAGTDCPIFLLTPGFSLHEELAMLVKAGLTPLEALKTATINPAIYFNMEKELGNIKENMWADLVLLDANPLENINNTKQINTVIKQGKVFNRMQLDALLKDKP
ncbi:MAG: imidazolonepropionase-like amidohydrolase [Maribacter sp.]|jgi:imidazolonepropionase-like amidohydrolase